MRLLWENKVYICSGWISEGFSIKSRKIMESKKGNGFWKEGKKKRRKNKE